MHCFSSSRVISSLIAVAMIVAASKCYASSSPQTNFAPTPVSPTTGTGGTMVVTSAQTVGGVGAPPGAFGVTPTASPVAFNPYTGNVSRVVTDLILPSVGEIGLEFKRYYHSRNTLDSSGNLIGSCYFGSGGNWRHSFQWDFTVSSDYTNIEVVYPDGSICDFANTTSSPTIYRPKFSAVTDFIVSTGTTTAQAYTFIRSNNQSYYFVETPSTVSLEGGTCYLKKIVDSKGNTTLMTWGIQFGNCWLLTNVTEPGKNELGLEYANYSTGSKGKSGLPSLTRVRGSFSPTMSAQYSYTQINYNVNTADLTSYTAYQCLTQVLYTTSAGTFPAKYTYNPTKPSLLPGSITPYYSVFPQLLTAADLHAEGPESVSFIYENNGTTQAGTVTSISDSTGNTLESADSSPTSPNTAGVIYQSSVNSNTNEYQYVVDAQGQVTKITDIDSANGVSQYCTTQYSVDSSGNVTTINTDANTHTTTTVRNGTGQVTSITYPPVGVETVGPNETWAYQQDANYFTYLASHTDPRGNTTHYSYESNKDVAQHPQLLISITYADSTSESFSYSLTLPYAASYHLAIIQVSSHVRRNGGTEKFTYGPSTGLLTGKTDAALAQTTYSYFGSRVLQWSHTADNKNTSTSIYTDYYYGDKADGTSYIETKNPLDGALKYTDYNKYGQIIWTTDYLGNYTYYTYDNLGRLASVTDPLNHSVTYSYHFPNNSSSPDTITYSNGITETISNEMLWGYKPLSITVTNSNTGQADPSTVGMAYDPMGNLNKITDPKGNITLIQYDQRNRKDWVKDPQLNVTTFSYDDSSNLTTQVSPTSVVQNVYDNMNRLYTCTVSNSLQTVTYQFTKYLYDAEGQLQHYYDPDNARYDYTYDNDERLLSMTYPDGTSESYTYDNPGNVLTFTTRDGRTKTTTYTYYNAPATIIWTGGTGVATPETALTYDTGRRVTAINNSNCKTAYTYDADNRMLSATQAITGWAPTSVKPVKYAYTTGDDTLQTLTYPEATPTVLTYAYYGRKEVKTISQAGVTNPLVTYAYDAANCTSKTLGNGVASTYGYDSLERLNALTDTVNSTTLQSYNYGYDTSSRLQYVQRDATHGDVYTYDPSDQLTKVMYGATNFSTSNPTSPSRTVTYTLDAAGNRSGSSGVIDSVNGTTSYSVSSNNANQYSNVGGSSVVYNNAGNLNSYSGWTYTYDANGHMTKALNSSTSAEADYEYDGLGRCVASYASSTGVTTYYLYDQGWNVLEEYTATGEFPAKPTLTETQRYVEGGSTDEIITKTNLVAMGSLAANTTLYYNYDGSGNVTKLTGSTGTKLEQYSYDVYGAATLTDGSGNPLTGTACANRYLFSGREYDSTTTLYHYRNRDYSPTLGRFLQPDPIGHAGDRNNVYRFCGNNPVGNADPSGLDDFSDGGFSLSADDVGLGGGSDGDVSISVGGLDTSFDFSSFAGGSGNFGIVTGNQSTLTISTPVTPVDASAVFPKSADSPFGTITDNGPLFNWLYVASVQFYIANVNSILKNITNASSSGEARSSLAIDFVSLFSGSEEFFAAEGTTTLYRSVSEAELRDIDANGLQQGAGSMGNKWFAETAGDAAQWGKTFYKFDQQPVFTIQVQVPDSVAAQMMRNASLDGIGPARSADGAVLQMINEQGSIKVLNGNVIPK